MSLQALIFILIAAAIVLGYMWYRRRQDVNVKETAAPSPEEGNEQ